MHPEVEHLLPLQDYDQRLVAAEAELLRIPKEEALLEQKLNSHVAQIEERKAKIRQLETNRKNLDLDVQSKQALIVKYKSQQLQTRKNEEFSALHHEIERAQNEITVLEDKELDLMGQIDEEQKQLAKEQEQFKAFETQTKQSKEALVQKRSSLELKIADLKREQQNAEQRVEEQALLRYRRILSSKKDIAVVPIVHGACGGCHMKLTSQTILTAKGGGTLIACENCGRIVYYTE
jgi:hypothetical protein